MDPKKTTDRGFFDDELFPTGPPRAGGEAGRARPDATEAESSYGQAATLLSSDGRSGGMALAMSGDTLVAGADVLATTIGGYGPGAYVFTRPGGGWSGTVNESAKLIPAGAGEHDTNTWFGFSVAISDDLIVVGDPFINDGAGAVYVFERPSGGWSGTLNESAKLVMSNPVNRSYFGWSVAISSAGDTIAVGAQTFPVIGNKREGAAYVFTRPGARWTGPVNESATLTAAGGSGKLGWSTAISSAGDTVIAAAPWHEGGGAVFVFAAPDFGWSGPQTQTALLTASDAKGGDQLGYAVAMSGDTVVASAPYKGDGGAACVFLAPASGWSGTMTESAQLISSGTTGFNVAIDGATVITGGFDLNGRGSYGYDNMFQRPPGGWTGTINESDKLIAPTGGSVGGGVATAGGVAASGDTSFTEQYSPAPRIYVYTPS